MKVPGLFMLKRFFRRFSFMILIIILSVVFAVTGLFTISLFRINTIQLIGTKSLIGLSRYNKSLLFLVNNAEVEKSLRAQNASIDSLFVQKKYPRTLLITVIKSPSVALLTVGGGWYFLNKDGKIVKKTRSKPHTSLPNITYFTRYPYELYQVGEKVNAEEVQYGAYFAHLLTNLSEKKINVVINQLFVIVLKNKDHEYWFTTKKSKEEQSALMKKIVRGLRIEGKKYKRIDVRFSKPVVELDTRK